MSTWPLSLDKFKFTESSTGFGQTATEEFTLLEALRVKLEPVKIKEKACKPFVKAPLCVTVRV